MLTLSNRGALDTFLHKGQFHTLSTLHSKLTVSQNIKFLTSSFWKHVLKHHFLRNHFHNVGTTILIYTVIQGKRSVSFLIFLTKKEQNSMAGLKYWPAFSFSVVLSPPAVDSFHWMTGFCRFYMTGFDWRGMVPHNTGIWLARRLFLWLDRNGCQRNSSLRLSQDFDGLERVNSTQCR